MHQAQQTADSAPAPAPGDAELWLAVERLGGRLATAHDLMARLADRAAGTAAAGPAAVDHRGTDGAPLPEVAPSAVAAPVGSAAPVRPGAPVRPAAGVRPGAPVRAAAALRPAAAVRPVAPVRPAAAPMPAAGGPTAPAPVPAQLLAYVVRPAPVTGPHAGAAPAGDPSDRLASGPRGDGRHPVRLRS